jgi:hypothetical protein
MARKSNATVREISRIIASELGESWGNITIARRGILESVATVLQRQFIVVRRESRQKSAEQTKTLV